MCLFSCIPYVQAQIQSRRTLLLQIRTGLLISDFGPWRHEERDTILKSLCWPYYADHTIWPHLNVRHISWCLRSLSVEICKTWPHASTAESRLNGPISTASFQNPQILRTEHDVRHTPVSFPVWGFIMTMVIVISFAHEGKTAPNDYTPELLTRIVQSLTKLNDKIIYEKWLI